LMSFFLRLKKSNNAISSFYKCRKDRKGNNE
jgi:hypothetical protein